MNAFRCRSFYRSFDHRDLATDGSVRLPCCGGRAEGSIEVQLRPRSTHSAAVP
jgi:hypothetical protein